MRQQFTRPKRGTDGKDLRMMAMASAETATASPWQFCVASRYQISLGRNPQSPWPCRTRTVGRPSGRARSSLRDSTHCVSSVFNMVAASWLPSFAANFSHLALSLGLGSTPCPPFANALPTLSSRADGLSKLLLPNKLNL